MSRNGDLFNIYFIASTSTKQILRWVALDSTEALVFPGGSVSKESTCNAGDSLQCRRPCFDSWVEKIPWRRKWQPTPVFLPGKSHGQRNLVGYSPWDHKRIRHGLATKQQNLSFKTIESKITTLNKQLADTFFLFLLPT